MYKEFTKKKWVKNVIEQLIGSSFYYSIDNNIFGLSFTEVDNRVYKTKKIENYFTMAINYLELSNLKLVSQNNLDNLITKLLIDGELSYKMSDNTIISVKMKQNYIENLYLNSSIGELNSIEKTFNINTKEVKSNFILGDVERSEVYVDLRECLSELVKKITAYYYKKDLNLIEKVLVFLNIYKMPNYICLNNSKIIFDDIKKIELSNKEFFTSMLEKDVKENEKVDN